MYKLIDIGEKALNIYNNIFTILFISILFWVVIKVMTIYQDNDKNKKMTFRVALNIGFKKLIEQLIAFGALCFIINMCIEISIFHLLLEYRLIKVLIGSVVVYDLWYTHKAYGRLRYDDFLDDIENGKYAYCPTQLEYENLIIHYQMSVELIKEKLGIIKSLTPISVITVIAGYVLKGEDIVVNWNGCTIIFVLIIILFIWSLYDNYKKLCDIKHKCLEVEKRLNKNRYQANDKV